MKQLAIILNSQDEVEYLYNQFKNKKLIDYNDLHINSKIEKIIKHINRDRYILTNINHIGLVKSISIDWIYCDNLNLQLPYTRYDIDKAYKDLEFIPFKTSSPLMRSVCDHEWIETIGFMNTYKDCKKCKIKFEEQIKCGY